MCLDGLSVMIQVGMGGMKAFAHSMWHATSLKLTPGFCGVVGLGTYINGI